MHHTIQGDRLGAQGPDMMRAIESCVHCGFCLPTCPTYNELGEEMDSPRGRILLMKSVLEGSLGVNEAVPYVDRCLGCQACVSACPSGVQYGDLLAPFRAYAEERRSRGPMKTLRRALVSQTLPHPDRFRVAAALGKVIHPLRRLVPRELHGMLDLLPARLPAAQPLPEIYPAEGHRRARVALLAGCVQQVLAPNINWATLRVLSKNGVETVIPRAQGCCGALMLHTGEAARARALAANNLRVFPRDIDAIISNAAGCGSGMKEYGLLFRGLPAEHEAEDFAGRVKDISVFLAELGLLAPPMLRQPMIVAYHDACHLAHAQGVVAPPREILRSIPNLTLREIPEGELCCGSAGVYNIEQPEIAARLGQRKAQNILQTGAQAVAAGNIGCLVQLRRHLQALGQDLPLYHTLELLDLAYRQA